MPYPADAARDAELVGRVAAGDEGALAELVDRYQHLVLNTAYRVAGDQDAAEDIAQEVFLVLWNRARTFRGEARLSTWLYRVTVNQCLQYRRRNRRTILSLDRISAEQPPESLQVEPDHVRDARVRSVRQAIAELPERQRVALVLAHYEGRPYREIAEIMGASVASVESLLFRARENLKGRLAR